MSNIAPCLWFDDQAEEAAAFYTSIFEDSKIVAISRYGPEGMRPEGMAMTVTFRLAGQEFMALNGGPEFTFSPAISLYVNCKTQEEVDELWEKLSEGGVKGQCGWLEDRYGVSWQIVPTALGELLQGGTAEQSRQVMHALLQMRKLDIETLRLAFEQE